MSVATSKVRIYDLAKDLKIDTKRLIEEVRREGVDVSVPSNSISKELAEKIRDKYFPKQSATVKRAVKIVKKAARPHTEEELAAPEPQEVAPAPAPSSPLRMHCESCVPSALALIGAKVMLESAKTPAIIRLFNFIVHLRSGLENVP